MTGRRYWALDGVDCHVALEACLESGAASARGSSLDGAYEKHGGKRRRVFEAAQPWRLITKETEWCTLEAYLEAGSEEERRVLKNIRILKDKDEDVVKKEKGSSDLPGDAEGGSSLMKVKTEGADVTMATAGATAAGAQADGAVQDGGIEGKSGPVVGPRVQDLVAVFPARGEYIASEDETPVRPQT